MRRTSAVRAVAATAVGVLAVAFLSSPARANHAPAFGPTWQTDVTPTYSFTPSVPAGEWRDRINNAVQQWNNVGEVLQFNGAATDSADRDPRQSCSGAGTVTMHRFNIDDGSGTLGLSGYCQYTSGGTGRFSSWIIFDSSEEWCTGTGNCYDGFLRTGLGADIDLWSIATHEMGHVSAIGHFESDDPVCEDNDSQATMCPFYSPGSERQRTLTTSIH